MECRKDLEKHFSFDEAVDIITKNNDWFANCIEKPFVFYGFNYDGVIAYPSGFRKNVFFEEHKKLSFKIIKDKRVCEMCLGEGVWHIECCSGAYNCTCHGAPVFMGCCEDCGGIGLLDNDYEGNRNIESISGKCFIGYNNNPYFK